jgi:predicted alpha/beta-fold hydrolase
VVILSHGLEGNSKRSYMLGMIKALNKNGWDGAAYNFRGCSGEPNRQLRSYHSGATDDLDTVVSHLLRSKHYKSYALVGFSIGGNLTLKYIGEKSNDLSPLIQYAAAISVPCDLESSAEKLSERSNMLYMKRFLRMFHAKIRSKAKLMPHKISAKNFLTIRTFKELDDRYTAPIHGFASAKDYWSKCSCKQFLAGINIPTLLINARDDPFLAPECYPLKEALNSCHLFLEMPPYGGHVGFMEFISSNEYWHEKRVVSFFSQNFH